MAIAETAQARQARYRRAARLTRLAKTTGQVIPHIILIILALGAVIPFVWMFFASFKQLKELINSLELLPRTWTLANYAQIVGRLNFANAFKNNVILSVSTTVAVVTTAAAAGFVFAKYQFRGKELLFTAILATMMVPFAVVLVPLYIGVAQMGLVNQLTGVIYPSLVSTFGIFMLRQFMETIPNELIDAARIDGAGEWRIFTTLIIPLTTAPMAALSVFQFLGMWDSFLWPMVVLNSPEKQNLPLLLAGLRSYYWTSYELWSAGSMLTVIPVMAIYAFASKWMIKGIAMSGMKL